MRISQTRPLHPLPSLNDHTNTRTQVGADVRRWFAAMPRSTRMLPQKRPASSLALAAATFNTAGGGAHPVGTSTHANASAHPIVPHSVAHIMGHTGLPPWCVQQGAALAGGGGLAVAGNNGVGAGGAATLLGSSTIDQFYLSRHCAVCDALTRLNRPVCDECASQPQTTIAVLQVRACQAKVLCC